MPGLDLNHSLLFPEEMLVAYANRLLEGSGSRASVIGAVWARHDHVLLLSQAENGRNVKLYAPVCEFTTGLVSFRSILQPTGAQPKWLPNGQASSDCEEIIFFGERGPKLASSSEALAAYMRSGKAENYQNPDWYRRDVEIRLDERLKRGLYGNTFDMVTEIGRAPLQATQAFAPAI